MSEDGLAGLSQLIRKYDRIRFKKGTPLNGKANIRR